MENVNTSFTEFAEAFDSDAGYQTDTAAETVPEEDITTQSEEAEIADTAEQTGGEDSEQPSDSPETQEDTTPPEEKAEPETFTLKVNKEEKTYTREEVISLAQKGADYDRVKEQLERSRQTAEDLQGKLDSQADAMEILADLAKETDVDVPQLLKNMRLSILKKQGLSDEAANERLLRMDAEKENAALKAAAETQPQETSAQRAQREIAEFREVYPDVEITQELVNELMEDVRAGKSFTEAYRKYEGAQKDARIAELEAQIAAEKQNKENRSSSPGSQKDSGGRRTKGDFDDFMEAFG